MGRVGSGAGRLALQALLALVLGGCGGGAEEPVTGGPVTAVRAAAAEGWAITPIGEGVKPTLALDRAGSPAVAYVGEGFGGFVAFASAAGGWAPETVSEGNFAGPADLAFDPESRAHVALHDHENAEVDVRAGNLVYAVRSRSGWQVETVRDQSHDGFEPSLAVDADGVVRVAANEPEEYRTDQGIEYYELGESGWAVRSIGSGPLDYKVSVSLAVSPDGLPAITYYDDARGDLVFAELDGEAWRLETVAADGDTGRFSSLAFDAAGRPHVSFFERTDERSGIVRYAVRERGEWRVEDVGSLGDVALGATGARRSSSLALDADGVPHVAFSDRSVLHYAVRSPSGWVVEDVVAARGRWLGQDVDLTVDAEGTPHLAFYEVTSEEPLRGVVAYLTRRK